MSALSSGERSAAAAGPVRVLAHDPARPLRRPAVDWMADRLAHARVLVPASARAGEDFPARLLHPPFAEPAAGVARLAAEVADLLAGAPAAEGETASPARPGAAPWAVEAAAIALLEEAAAIAVDVGVFRDLTALSSWSMNVPERPTDGLIAQHLGIAGRMAAAFRADAAVALEALLAGDAGRLGEIARARRRRAREDGPVRFRRIAKRSAGLRPFVVYLDLVPLAAAAPAARPAPAERFALLDRDAATALLSTAAVLFV